MASTIYSFITTFAAYWIGFLIGKRTIKKETAIDNYKYYCIFFTAYDNKYTTTCGFAKFECYPDCYLSSKFLYEKLQKDYPTCNCFEIKSIYKFIDKQEYNSF